MSTLPDQLNALEARLTETRATVTQKFLDVETEFSNRFVSLGDRVQNSQASVLELGTKLEKFSAAIAEQLTKSNNQVNDLHSRAQKLESVPARNSAVSDEATRTIAGASKPPVYSAEAANISFQDWSHKLRVYVNSLSRDSRQLLAWVCKQSDEITYDKVPADKRKTCDLERLSESLYAIVSAYTDGEALKMVNSQDAEFNGPAAL